MGGRTAPGRWNLNATLLGSGRQRVPLIVYWSMHLHFLSYPTAIEVLAAGMLVLFLLDGATECVGRLY